MSQQGKREVIKGEVKVKKEFIKEEAGVSDATKHSAPSVGSS
jgi:hypothetical protein